MSHIRPTILAAAVLAAPNAVFADDIGYAELVARLGQANVPTGAGVGIAQVEAPDGSGNYGPNQADADFVGTAFTLYSGATGTSGHANTVALLCYGNSSSVAPGITQVGLYNANGFVTSQYLRTGQGTSLLPLATPAGIKLFNNSWIGSFGTSANDNDCLRRADYAMQRDDTLFIEGLNNGAGAVPALLASTYHGVSVGRMDGSHSAGLTISGLDGPGRMKPEIVAPGTYTSFSTPVVTAVTSLLYQTAVTWPGLSTDGQADEGVVIKAALLGGGRHRTGWANNAPQSGASRGIATAPLSSVYGVDVVNADRSHRILSGLQQAGQASVPSASSITEAGWDYVDIAASQTLYWRFRIAATADEVAILCTWNRLMTGVATAGTVAAVDLRLYRAQGLTLLPMEGDAGLEWFASGNCQSSSAVDNIEHLYLKGLVPGEYVIEVKRTNTGSAVPLALAWIMPDQPDAIPGDIDGNGTVDGLDLSLLLSSFGYVDPQADLDGDGIVGGSDLAILLGNWV